MCGVAGYVGHGDHDILKKMTDTLTRRGPDDAGYIVFGNVGLGHRRLSIIDLSPTGHQPMTSADGTVTIVFNGEIYNYTELKKELNKNYSFRGNSDTEVILAAYQAYGLDCFKKMNGMFAIALYDQKNDRLALARDRLGKKPLYWTVQEGTLLFGSELKALLQHPAFNKEIDPKAVAMYTYYDYIPTPYTIYRGVQKLEPGMYLAYEKGAVRKEKFWDVGFGGGEADRTNRTDRTNKVELLAELGRRLERATAMRLVSDVPLGIFLSGGLDSSTIAYYAAKASPAAAGQIKTFSIGFDDSTFDESAYARQVAKFLGTDHHERMITSKEAMDIIPRIADILDEPMADNSIIPTTLLSRFTREHVTVALGGDGGDELFLGYPTFRAERLMQWGGHLFRALSPMFNGLAQILPASHGHYNARFQMEQFLRGLKSAPIHRHHDWMGTFSGEMREKLLVDRTRWDVYDILDKYVTAVAGEPQWNKLIYLYLRTYLMDQVMVKVDRASMAAALETRAPFLDYEFVDFVNAIPYTYKLHGLQTKHLLKELMKDKLPREIVYRPKRGFGAPVGRWLAGPLSGFLRETLSEENVQRAGVFKPEYVSRLVNDHIGRKYDHRKKLWNLVVFQLWWERWVK